MPVPVGRAAAAEGFKIPDVHLAAGNARPGDGQHIVRPAHGETRGLAGKRTGPRKQNDNRKEGGRRAKAGSRSTLKVKRTGSSALASSLPARRNHQGNHVHSPTRSNRVTKETAIDPDVGASHKTAGL